MKKKNAGYIITAVVLTGLFAAAATFFTRTDSEWYMGLNKPAIQPPPIAFAIAWTAIYALFAASFSVTLIKREGKGAMLYILNLVLTTLWCVLFFIRQSPGAALVLLLVIFILAIILAYNAYNTSVAAGAFITPYVLWIAFALTINYGVVLLN